LLTNLLFDACALCNLPGGFVAFYGEPGTANIYNDIRGLFAGIIKQKPQQKQQRSSFLLPVAFNPAIVVESCLKFTSL
jgi:hypothetical protein